MKQGKINCFITALWFAIRKTKTSPPGIAM